MSARPRAEGLVRKLGLGALGLTLAITLSSSPAEARHHAHHSHHRGHIAYHRAMRGHHHGGHAMSDAQLGRAMRAESPVFSADLIDAGSGRVLYTDHANELRHPASLTKVMTLYLLFEKLRAGEMHLSDRIEVSAHAASMAPTKLGLRPGSTIAVEDAIKAIVTKSANDMAVAVAESIGGDERSFATLMTRKARQLGMSRTQYVNASGLPNAGQLTTAHDLTLLGRAIYTDFPQYYHFFSIPSFTYAGMTMPNHNHLMSRMEGMDGIKTGFTNASGFNLLSSIHRDGHHLIGVVLGGRSAASRDRIMASLIEDHIEEAAPTRVADAPEPGPVERHAETVADRDDEDTDSRRAPRELAAAPLPPVHAANLIAPTLAVPPAPEARPATRAKLANRIDEHEDAPVEPTAPKVERAAYERSEPEKPAGLHWVTGPSGVKLPNAAPPRPFREHAEAEGTDPTPTGSIQAANGSDEHAEAKPAADAPARGGWVIQIGATDGLEKANELLDRARTEGRSFLADAQPVTEKVQKGGATLYRARFAGLDPREAQSACRALKRSGFACFAVKN